jgi:hypothetical protein
MRKEGKIIPDVAHMHSRPYEANGMIDIIKLLSSPCVMDFWMAVLPEDSLSDDGNQE